jgi:hypothetical protein
MAAELSAPMLPPLKWTISQPSSALQGRLSLLGASQDAEDDVERAGAQFLDQGVVLAVAEVKADVGRRPPQPRHGLGRRRHGRRDRPDPYHRLAPRGGVGHVDEGVVGGRQQTQRVRQEGRAGVGQADVMGAAVEQAQAQVFLDLPDAGAQGGLGDDHPLGRPAEIARLGQGREKAKLAQRYGLGARRRARERCGRSPGHGGVPARGADRNLVISRSYRQITTNSFQF